MIAAGLFYGQSIPTRAARGWLSAQSRLQRCGNVSKNFTTPPKALGQAALED